MQCSLSADDALRSPLVTSEEMVDKMSKFKIDMRVLGFGGEDSKASAESLESVVDSPVVAFVNSKSGGYKGKEVIKVLGQMIGENQVIILFHLCVRSVRTMRFYWDAESE